METKIANLNEIIRRGDIDDALDAGLTDQEIVRIREGAQTFGEHRDIDSAMPHLVPKEALQRSYAARELTKLRGRPVGEKEVTVAEMKAVTTTQIEEERRRMLRRMKADRVKQMATQAIKDPTTSEAVLKAWDGRQMSSFITEKGREGIDEIQDRLYALASSPPPIGVPNPSTSDVRVTARVAQGVPVGEAQRRARMQLWLEANGNAPLAKYLQSQGGQNLGFTV